MRALNKEIEKREKEIKQIEARIGKTYVTHDASFVIGVLEGLRKARTLISMKGIKMKKPLWEVSSIQFPRLIAELEAAGAFTDEVYKDLCESMDLTVDEVVELVDRAQNEWDRIKQNLKKGSNARKK
jgi:hypothetical protein